jgi:acetoin utilization deacetylase AcuC-like enzyme
VRRCQDAGGRPRIWTVLDVTTALLYDERCLLHDNGSMILDERARDWLTVPHFERPERVARTVQVLERAGVLDQLHRVAVPEATSDDLVLAHTREFVRRIHAACRRGEFAWVGPEARVGPKSWTPAVLAAGGAVAAVDAVLEGTVRNAFVMLRPPGHHSTKDTAMGFCLFNSVAVAARHAQRRRGLKRLAIVDWDVHHGNGTQDHFYDDPSVLFVSIHQDDLYPAGSGTLEQSGGSSAEGGTVNIPLPAGSGDHGYAYAFERIVEPILEAFRPELLLVSAGQDPAASDPLGRMSVTTEGFRDITARAQSAAARLCEDRLVVLLEGGYSLEHAPFCTLAIVEALAGLPPSFGTDPIELDVPDRVRTIETGAVEAAAETYARWWPSLIKNK